MIQFPNSKINLGLNITEKRQDGFHNIESCFYPINWCDILEINPSNELLFNSSGIEIPGKQENNICLNAYHLLQKDYDIGPVNIHLHKKVPIGAGLGGGSADGAFTLKMLNSIFQLQLTDEKLIEYARLLGSDCAFFIKNKPVIATLKGDHFSDTQLDLSKYYIYLVYPDLHISTQKAYSGVSPKPVELPISTILQKPIQEWNGQLINDFEASIAKDYSVINTIKETMNKAGALYSAMTGSGSTVFGIFASEPQLEFEEYKYKTVLPMEL